MDGCKGLCGIFANQSINCVIRQIVRNYGARNNLKSMKRGDFAFFYHRFVCPPKSRYHKNEEEKKKKKDHVVQHYLLCLFILVFPKWIC